MLYYIVSSAFAALCEPNEAARLVASLPDDPDARQTAAMAGFERVCYVPSAVADATRKFAAAPEADRLWLEISALQILQNDWVRACPAGLGVFERAVADPDRARAISWQDCELSKQVWFTADEWLAADGPAILPLLAGQAMLDGGVAPENARQIVRAMARVAEPHPVVEVVEEPLVIEGAPTVSVVRGAPGLAPDGVVAPSWTDAERERGGTCVVTVAVESDGTLAGIRYTACDRRYRRAVVDAVVNSTFLPAGGELELAFTVPR